MMKKTVLAGFLFALVLTLTMTASPIPAQAAGVVKIGVFDLQTAINKSKKGQAAKAALVKKFERLQRELKLAEAEIQRMQKELANKSSVLSQEAKYEKEKTMKRKVRDFQDKYRDYSDQMKKEEYESTQPLVQKMLATANSIGKEKGYTLILEAQKAGVIYAPDAIDITQEVIRRFDSGKINIFS